MQKHIDKGELNLVLFDYLINHSNKGEFTLDSIIEDFNILGLRANWTSIEDAISKYIYDGFVEEFEDNKYIILL